MASSDETHQTPGVGIDQMMDPHRDLHTQDPQASDPHMVSGTEPHQPQTSHITLPPPAQNPEVPDVDMGSSNVSSLDEVSSTPGAVQAYVANSSNAQATVDIEDGYYPTSLHIDSEISDTDSALGSDVQSSTMSLRESLYESVMENGREYHKYKQGQYYLPNDDVEQDRLNLQHHLWTLTLDGRLHLAPIANPQRVLDIGTGTGLWALEYAERNPSATVIGTGTCCQFSRSHNTYLLSRFKCNPARIRATKLPVRNRRRGRRLDLVSKI